MSVERFFKAAGSAGVPGKRTMKMITPAGDTTLLVEKPSFPANAPLSSYVGTYVSDELDTTWRIEQRDSTLIVRRGAVPDITLQPVFLDAFSSPLGVIRFARAADGRVTGLVVGAGRVTGFVFRRAPHG